MDTNNFKQNVDEWLTLSNQGLFVEARKFYFENLFEGIIDLFVSKTALENHCDVLFSILGFLQNLLYLHKGPLYLLFM